MNFLKLLINNKEEKILLVVDTDSININEKTVVSKLKDILNEEQARRFYKNNIIYIGEKEFEDCFQDDYIADVLNKSEYKKNDNLLWESEDISKNRSSKKFSDSILKMVNTYEKDNGKKNFINKPILGRLLAENIEPKYIPKDINNVITKIRKIAGIQEIY